MKNSKGLAPHWAGMWQPNKSYDAGAIVVDRRGLVQCSKVDGNDRPPGDPYVTTNHGYWAALGASGAMPTKAVHAWNPGDMQYPCGNEGEMSEQAIVCKDCVKDADFRNAFSAQNHLYIIREVGPPRD